MWYHIESTSELRDSARIFGTNYDMYVGWTQQMMSACGAARYLPASINKYMAMFYSL